MTTSARRCTGATALPLQSGSTRFAFENIVPAWLSYPRAGDVALYFGLGAYRVGTGDGGANPDSVSGWSTGSALAAQVKDLRQQAAGGWALYRYGSLFGPEAPRTGRGRVCSAAGAESVKICAETGGKPHKINAGILCRAAKCGILTLYLSVGRDARKKKKFLCFYEESYEDEKNSFWHCCWRR